MSSTDEAAARGGAVPRLAHPLRGIGGHLKERPEDFEVVEIPLYQATGEGEHVYLTVRRSGWTTPDVQAELMRIFDLEKESVGFAGMKDRHALTTQTFSLALGDDVSVEEVRRRVEGESPFHVVKVDRHGNKLKLGHLLGNRFRIRVRGAVSDSLERVRPILDVVRRRGVPNAFGPQRFGVDGANAEKGRALLAGRRERRGFLRRLYLSAWQSRVFNAWLARRIQSDHFDCLLEGDVAKKTDTGGLFTVTDPLEDTARLHRGEIVPTGPLFGYRMRAALGEPGRVEEEMLRAEGVDATALRRLRVAGDRRRARVDPKNLEVTDTSDGPVFAFELPKGAYATVVMREFLENSESEI